MYTGHSVRQETRKRRAKELAKGILVGRRNSLGNEVHCPVDQHAGRLAVVAADDLAADGIGRVVGDAGNLHGFAVGPAGMAVHAPQPYRAVGHHGVDISGGREFFHRPDNLVPAPALDPVGVGIVGGIGADEVDRGIEGRRAEQVQAALQGPVVAQVRVPVDQPGQQRAPFAVNTDGVRVVAEQGFIAGCYDLPEIGENENTELPDTRIRGRVAGDIVDCGFAGKGRTCQQHHN